MLQFREAANQSKNIWMKYKKLKTNRLPLEYFKQLNATMIEGLEDQETVTKFYKWIITTMNDNIFSVDDLCAG